jgi:polyisoprenoid-binding protein YceI
LVRLSVCCKFLLAGVLVASQTATGGPQANAQQANTPHSSITIHVYKAGLFSALGHNHTVVAPIAQGAIDLKGMAVEITVASKQMRVTDPEASESTRSEVQADMQGSKVLDAGKYPEIRFKSSHVQQAGPQRYHVTGALSLHGVTKELSFDVSGGPDHYQGKTKLNQTDFGMKPISGGGGAVKVKDQLDLEFDIYAGDLTNASHR